jgi:hypothetical protein
VGWLGPYTLLQLLEIAAFTVVALFGVLARHPSMASLGIGLLVSKAVANSLPPRLTVITRNLVGYGLGLLLAAAMVLTIRFVVL